MTLNIILLLTALLTALISGFFYAYVCSVNPGLGGLADVEYLRAMQSINQAVLNPVFFASFMGTLILLPISTWMSYREGGMNDIFYLLLAASIIYIFGVFLVTGMGNVPLNDSLAKIELAIASPDNLKKYREAFEGPWNKFNLIRTIANLVSLALILIALIKK